MGERGLRSPGEVARAGDQRSRQACANADEVFEPFGNSSLFGPQSRAGEAKKCGRDESALCLGGERRKRLLCGVEIADAQKVKGLAPLACKTDRIDAWVLAELARRDLVPAIWLPDPLVRAERERARWRLHLVRHRSSLKQRVHAVLLTHGKPCPVSDLFGVRGRQLLSRLDLPEPWQGTIDASLRLIDELDREIGESERELRRLGADHHYVPLLCRVPGISWVLAYTIAAELGDIGRFPTPRKLVGYSGLCPRVYQSAERDLRGPLAKQGPRYLRWALVEAATHACTHPAYRQRYTDTKARIGKQRGAKVAQVDLARRLAEAIWHMLTRGQPFAPKGATDPLAA
jgi:transposase